MVLIGATIDNPSVAESYHVRLKTESNSLFKRSSDPFNKDRIPSNKDRLPFKQRSDPFLSGDWMLQETLLDCVIEPGAQLAQA